MILNSPFSFRILLPEITVTSLSTQPLDARIDELMFLAEAITEQTKRLESIQAKYSRQLRKVARRQSQWEESSNKALEIGDSAAKTNESGVLQEQLNELQINLAKKEEKLRAQSKSLTLRFKAERVKLQLEKQEFESRKTLHHNSDNLHDTNQIDTFVQEPKPVLSASNESSFPTTEKLTGFTGDVDSSDNLESIAAIEARLAELQELLAITEDENHKLLSENQVLRDQLRSDSQDSDSGQPSPDFGELFDARRQLDLTLEQLQDARSEIARLKANDVDMTTAEKTWEEQKQLLLASLEGDTETTLENPREVLERLKMAEDLLSQKDCTIAHLEELLESYQEMDRAAIAKEEKVQHKTILDSDEVITAERQRLAELEQYWRDKIGKAEMELSQERSRLSRDRAALDAKQIELQKQAGESVNSTETTDAPQEPRKRKWRERLGL